VPLAKRGVSPDNADWGKNETGVKSSGFWIEKFSVTASLLDYNTPANLDKKGQAPRPALIYFER
jgi:hypothetical protein